MNPWLVSIAIVAAAALVAVAWGAIEEIRAARAGEVTVQPYVAPSFAHRCEAAHCGLPAFAPATRVSGEQMWVCAGDRDRGYREGWLVRPDWFANNYEARVLLPADTDERTDYLTQLAHEAEHGPADDPHDPQNVARR